MTLERLALDCLILAAGNSSRFGSCKLLADFHGQPLISAAVTAARVLKPAQILVVAGAFYEELFQMQTVLNNGSPPVDLLQFHDWQSGMGSSLAFGIKQLAADNAVLILLGDQPLISSQDLQNLYRAWCANPEQIACASFANTHGVPAIFPALFKTQLRACAGDQGAKALLINNQHHLISVPVASAEFDVDTRADLDDLLLKSAV
ncbi:MAG: nucleotidyltransferase family protein [Pseudomonadota bacterium]